MALSHEEDTMSVAVAVAVAVFKIMRTEISNYKTIGNC